MEGTCTEFITRFAADIDFKDIPNETTERAKVAILDGIGNIIGAYATNHSVVRAILAYLGEANAKRESSVLGWGRRVGCLDAVWANGVLANFLDYSDGHNIAGGHVNDRIVPIVLAVGEREGASGKEILESVIVGYEVYIGLGRAMFIRSPKREKSPHFNSLDSIVGALPAGRLLGLNRTQMENSLALAASGHLWGRMYSSTGGSEKELSVGHAVHRAVLSALLARKGILGSRSFIENERGFCRSVVDECIFDELTKDLGSRFRMDECYFKPYPACRYTHGSIDACLDIMSKHSIDLESIAEILVRTNTVAASVANYDIASHNQAIFSHPYQVSVVLKEGKPDLPTSWNKKMEDPVIRKLIRKVKVFVDKKMEQAYKSKRIHSVTLAIRMNNGQKYNSTIFYPKGDPNNPMTRGELQNKFMDSVSTILTETRIKDLIRTIDRLEQIDNINELTEILHA